MNLNDISHLLKKAGIRGGSKSQKTKLATLLKKKELTNEDKEYLRQNPTLKGMLELINHRGK